MLKSTAPHLRFKEARERADISVADLSYESGVSSDCIRDIEAHEDELASCYSPKQLQRIAQILRIRPFEFFADTVSSSPVSADQLVQLIHAECRSRNLSLEQFEDVVGWKLNGFMDPPERLFETTTVDGLQWLCQELRLDWRDVLLSLQLRFFCPAFPGSSSLCSMCSLRLSFPLPHPCPSSPIRG